MERSNRIPGATYRLQFNAAFGFSDAEGIVGYLKDLGITDCYASPLFPAGPSSTHGYDVCGFDRLNSRLGGETGFARFAAALKRLNLGLLLDMVPNHMGNGASNNWWVDVLKNGETSAYAKWFDIDWEASREWTRTGRQVLIPVLEARYGQVLESGKLKVVNDQGCLYLQYHDNRFPLNGASIREIQQNTGESPGSPGFEAALNRYLAALNGRPGEPESFRDLDRLIRDQHYRLAFWRIAPEEINYRRFFDITELVSMRMELQEVFEATHKLVCSMIERGQVTGLRIDHPDGLLEPLHYFQRLQRETKVYVVAEKILTGEEGLPQDWPVDGTTGYDFLQRVNGLFVQAANESAFSEIYTSYTGEANDLPELISACKQLVLERSFTSEVNSLTKRLRRLCQATMKGQDFTESELRRAISDTAVAFPVYRTYITNNAGEVSDGDKEAIRAAVSKAKEHPKSNTDALDFLHGILIGQFPADFTPETRDAAREFTLRFQQLTGPLMAKGLEDTAFYRYNRLISLNEVGGAPDRFGISLEQFHDYNAGMMRRHPHTLLATSTHDTKRGEDVRARLNVLSEIPEDWEKAIRRWRELTKEFKESLRGSQAPDPNDEYFIYQTLIGAWPESDELSDFTGRVVACIKKSIKESKRHTSWTDPSPEYEAATEQFIRKMLASDSGKAFLTDFLGLERLTAFHGAIVSLSQTLLKLTCPGVPDIYQGTELWDLSLVDPDNRRSVDYGIRQSLLGEFKARVDPNRNGLLRELLENWESGSVKLFLIWQALALRNSKETVFKSGDYVPLQVSGGRANHVCAFARVSGKQAVITIVPRFTCTLMNKKEQFPLGGDVWVDTTLHFPASFSRVHDVFTLNAWDHRKELLLGDVLGSFPVALLVGEM